MSEQLHQRDPNSTHAQRRACLPERMHFRFACDNRPGSAWTDSGLHIDPEGRVVAADSANMYCLNVTSGIELWRMPVWTPAAAPRCVM